MTKVKSNNGNEKKKKNQTLFYGTYPNLTSFFIDCKILKYFNDFNNWHLSVSSPKVSKVKMN